MDLSFRSGPRKQCRQRPQRGRRRSLPDSLAAAESSGSGAGASDAKKGFHVKKGREPRKASRSSDTRSLQPSRQPSHQPSHPAPALALLSLAQGACCTPRVAETTRRGRDWGEEGELAAVGPESARPLTHAEQTTLCRSRPAAHLPPARHAFRGHRYTSTAHLASSA
eukprot:1147522-Rhodomonas_salina.1